MYKLLFSEKKIGSMTVPNRIVMTAMGNHCANSDGTASDTDVAFYGARARGGVGLIITECVVVDSTNGKGNLRQLALDDDRYIEGIGRIAEEVHKYGSKLAVQLYHPGRQGIAPVNGVDSMPSPSATECQCVHQPTHAMSVDEIKEMIDKFVLAAARAHRAGADAVELHGAHGYLIGQFLSPYTNLRTDEYGGSPENRLRFLDEIIAGIRNKCGPDYPILVRLSVDEHLEYAGQPDQGIHLSDGVAIAKHLESVGVDAIDVSAGIYETMNTAWEPIGFKQGWKIHGPAAIKAAVSIPVIGVSVIRDPAYAETILEEGKLDFIGSARAFLAEPEWGLKAKEGRECEIRRCLSCLYCMETLMGADMCDIPVGCAINFEGIKEDRYQADKLQKTGNGRVVAVIGSGPAGMEAARILAIRGFKPVIFEKESHVGGQLDLADKAPMKENIGIWIDYELGQLKKSGVDIRLNTTASIDELISLNPYAVFLATGSAPVLPNSISGIDGIKVYTPDKILNGSVKLSDKNICIVGSGMTGLETAEFLAEQGNQISVYEMAQDIGPGFFFQNLIDIMGRIAKHNVALYPNHRLLSIDDQAGSKQVTFETTDTGEMKQFNFDAVVISIGVSPVRELEEELKAAFKNVKILGDAESPGRIAHAISSGYLAAAELE